YIEALDPEARYFNKEDLAAIEKMEGQILEDWNSRSCQFAESVAELLKKRLRSLEQQLQNWEEEAFVFDVKDTLYWSPKLTRKHAPELSSQIQSWKDRIKYRSLLALQEDLMPIPAKKMEEEAFAKQIDVLQNAQCQIQALIQDEISFDQYFRQKFMDALSQSYDPHTAYFSFSEKELWDLALATQSLSFGMEFKKNRQGQLQISQLRPGGAGWKSQRLHQGDEVLEIEYPQGTALDLNCMSIKELAEKLKSSVSNYMDLKIRKRNGETHEFRLYKEKAEQEENILSSYILEGDQKVGYLYLPAFYTEAEDATNRGCADDVARELLRLQAEGIEGLILDLRFNGGGSMKEALSLAGIFIDRGPLAIFQERGQAPTLLRDMNRGSFYDGPLIVMINGYSASASEILASALQDYQRALIVGSKSFGKSSGQIVLPVVGEGLGMAKVSIQQYFRIKGNSYQKRGVSPDISLPNIDEVLGEKESDHIRAFSHSFTDKEVTFSPSGRLPIDPLQEKSIERIAKNKDFQKVSNLIQEIKDWKQEKAPFVLHPDHFYKGLKIQVKFALSLEMKKEMESSFFVAKNNRFVASLLKLEPEKQILNQQQLLKVAKDVYIEETYLIMKDLIQAQ
ncbi:MAG: S41 family peptidase, partial [Bacteroidota bacterium]